jgi:hypothetical protein
MRNIFILIILAGASVQFWSCELIDEPEPIPAYVYIDTIRLETQQNDEGTNSHKIKDAWLFVDNQLIGPYELPMSAPVLHEGEHMIEVFAGMADNGIISYPEVYPFYNRYVTTRNFVPGETMIVEPTVTYIDKTVFAFIEDFEGGNLFGSDLDGNDATTVERVSAGKFEGLKSGKITLTAANSIFEVATLIEYSLINADNPTSPIYLELNYKNNIPFEVGIMGFKNNAYVNKVYVTGMNVKEDWNKIYINLTTQTGLMDADRFKIVIRSTKGAEVETGEIYLDNIKLLHF